MTQWHLHKTWSRCVGMYLLEVRQMQAEVYNWRVLDVSQNATVGELVAQGSTPTCDKAKTTAQDVVDRVGQYQG